MFSQNYFFLVMNDGSINMKKHFASLEQIHQKGKIIAGAEARLEAIMQLIHSLLRISLNFLQRKLEQMIP